MVATVIELGDPTGYTCRRGNLVNLRSSRSMVVVHLIVELDGSDDYGRRGTLQQPGRSYASDPRDLACRVVGLAGLGNVVVQERRQTCRIQTLGEPPWYLWSWSGQHTVVA